MHKVFKNKAQGCSTPLITDCLGKFCNEQELMITNTLFVWKVCHCTIGWMTLKMNSPKKWLHNRIYCPGNRSKQIKETHTAYYAGTQYTRQSLNEKEHTWLHRQTVIVCGAMYIVFLSNFAAYIVCRSYKRCEFLGFVWTDCRGNKPYYVITSPANSHNMIIGHSAKLVLISLKNHFLRMNGMAENF